MFSTYTSHSKLDISVRGLVGFAILQLDSNLQEKFSNGENFYTERLIHKRKNIYVISNNYVPKS